MKRREFITLVCALGSADSAGLSLIPGFRGHVVVTGPKA
jgi:hypothetical protein